MSISKPFNLMKWIAEHEDEFKMPVMNKQFYREANDVVVFVSKGPNTRNDYHVNPTEELFYQLKGDISVRIRPLDGTPPHEVVIREGEMWLCPRLVPHRPQRPADTLGLIVEFPRPLCRAPSLVLQQGRTPGARSRISTGTYRQGSARHHGQLLEWSGGSSYLQGMQDSRRTGARVHDGFDQPRLK